MKSIIDVASSAAREAGALLMEGFGGSRSIMSKADHSLVTDIDTAAEKLIADMIRSSFPSHRILAEEGSTGSPDGAYTWVIDPLDGTHNFIKGIKLFGVSIGVLAGQEFAAGVIYMPCDDELFVAEKGSGARRNGTPIAVSKCGALANCSLHLDSGLRTGPEWLGKLYQDLGGRAFNARMLGSSARLFAYLAEGKLDAAVEFDDKVWDYAAGVCILSEAGGVITEISGKALTPASTNYVASNGLLQKEMEAVISRYL